ncbi:MAG: cation-translocating P-type ATPase C-terminal domain-containing protein [Deltaproteobacteria bacterium]
MTSASSRTPQPSLPLQILYINLIGDVLPALGLGLGKGYSAVMQVPPRDPQEPFLTSHHWLAVMGWSALIAAPILGPSLLPSQNSA